MVCQILYISWGIFDKTIHDILGVASTSVKPFEAKAHPNNN
jgi:hypothetical protein